MCKHSRVKDSTELADVFNLYANSYIAKHRLSKEQHKAVNAIRNCRTAALGGNVQRCACCGAEFNLNSAVESSLSHVFWEYFTIFSAEIFNVYPIDGSKFGGFRIRPPRYLTKARLKIKRQRSEPVNCSALAHIDFKNSDSFANCLWMCFDFPCMLLTTNLVWPACLVYLPTASRCNGLLVIASVCFSGVIERTNNVHQL